MKLGNMSGWRVCAAGEGIVLPGPERLLSIDVVGYGPWQMLHGTEVYPLGVLDGRVKLECIVSGDVELHFVADEGVMFRTHDQENLGVVDGRYTESYTVMWERGPQENPEFRRMMMIAQLRDEERQRQMAAMVADMRALQERADANRVSAAGSAAPAPAGGAGANPASAPDGAVSGAAAGGVAGTAPAASEPAGSLAGNAGAGVSQQSSA